MRIGGPGEETRVVDSSSVVRTDDVLRSGEGTLATQRFWRIGNSFRTENQVRGFKIWFFQSVLVAADKSPRPQLLGQLFSRHGARVWPRRGIVLHAAPLLLSLRNIDLVHLFQTHLAYCDPMTSLRIGEIFACSVLRSGTKHRGCRTRVVHDCLLKEIWRHIDSTSVGATLP